MMIVQVLALSLFEDELLQVFILEDAWVFIETVVRLDLLIIFTVLFILQRFLGGDAFIHHLPFFLLLLPLVLGRTHPLIHAVRRIRHLVLA